jgi:type 1 glutamine amidotransferase
MRWLYGFAVVALAFFAPVVRAEDKPKRLLLVTHSGGFIHDSVGVAEQVLKEIGPRYGFQVTCYRFTADPDAPITTKRKVDGKEETVQSKVLDVYSKAFRERTGFPVEKENCGRINAETLKNFDIVLFFTTGSRKSQLPAPLTDDELNDLMTWVKNGGAFAGTHCGSDTLYDTPYGGLVGAFFKTHPAGIQKIRVHVEDPNHAAAKGFTDAMEFADEMYIFTDASFSRDRLHVILSIEKGSFNPGKNAARSDNDYAISWCQQYGKGRSFYTSFGHRKEVWKDPRFQEHLMGGLKWSLGQAPGDATPSGKASK